MKTYLELVNQVLVAMRESEVSDVTQNNYTKMVGKFVNDAKQQCEDANNWEANLESITLGTIAGIANISLTGYGQRGTIDTVVETTNNNYLRAVSRRRMRDISRGSTTTGILSEYANQGVDPVGDSVITVYPLPVSGQEVEVTGWFRQADLVSNGDTMRIPHRCVVELAIALAVRERGEVSGQMSQEYFEIAKRTLSDAIAYDSAKNDGEDTWYVEGVEKDQWNNNTRGW
jgi:hypothetical protein